MVLFSPHIFQCVKKPKWAFMAIHWMSGQYQAAYHGKIWIWNTALVTCIEKIVIYINGKNLGGPTDHTGRPLGHQKNYRSAEWLFFFFAHWFYLLKFFISSDIMVFSSDLQECRMLTPKHRETHGCVVSTVATDALVLKHQAITIHNADQTFIVLDQFHIKILRLWCTRLENEISFRKKWPSSLRVV